MPFNLARTDINLLALALILLALSLNVSGLAGLSFSSLGGLLLLFALGIASLFRTIKDGAAAGLAGPGPEEQLAQLTRAFRNHPKLFIGLIVIQAALMAYVGLILELHPEAEGRHTEMTAGLQAAAGAFFMAFGWATAAFSIVFRKVATLPLPKCVNGHEFHPSNDRCPICGAQGS